MKILVDFAFANQLSEPGAAFFEHLFMLYARHFAADELIIISCAKQTHPLPDNSRVVYTKPTGFSWLKTSRLNNLVQQENPTAIIRFEKETIQLYQRKKNKPVANIAFTAHHQALVVNKAISSKKMIPPVVSTSTDTLSWSEKESLKISYTGGREYFLAAGTVQNADYYIALLKAYSQFKKRQLSDMKLLLVTEPGPASEELEEKLKTYKYRHDVEMTEQPELQEFEKLMSCAYAYIDLNAANELSYPLLMAAQTETAIIAADTEVSRQLAPVATYFTTSNLQQEVYDAISQLYKDENLKFTMAGSNKEAAQKNDVTQMLKTLRDFIVSQV